MGQLAKYFLAEPYNFLNFNKIKQNENKIIKIRKFHVSRGED